MLILENVVDTLKCDINIDYYVPFTVNVECEDKYGAKVCWRTGNFKNSLIEIALDARNGILRDITLISIDKAVLLDTVLEDIDDVESGTPVFLLEGNTKNGIHDHLMNFTVFLGLDFIMVNLEEDSCICKFIELERVRFGIDSNNKLVSITIRNLSEFEYGELKDSLKYRESNKS